MGLSGSHSPYQLPLPRHLNIVSLRIHPLLSPCKDWQENNLLWKDESDTWENYPQNPCIAGFVIISYAGNFWKPLGREVGCQKTDEKKNCSASSHPGRCMDKTMEVNKQMRSRKDHLQARGFLSFYDGTDRFFLQRKPQVGFEVAKWYF